ncbi:AraC family transcriptional regulator [Solihabitans fulvus]|uniref:AraC family transcriptional regulator n=1 Tax=Solihabitans fulvus TaxID=1892852 RepID=A0A5B2XQP7_9PSEU|nr:AraC family transcriptional regulator ligand-binding domain-containing protein [Solihabitans fulvus]KAA2265405.1 AraC family transcriptional regulator [Solihabitans fulvus]
MRRAVEAGLESHRLAHECGFPSWAMTNDDVRVPSRLYLRTWEVVEHGLGDADAAVRIAERYVVGEVGLYDYLFTTAPTLGAGLALCGPYVGAISTNFRFEPGPETEQEISFEVAMINGDGRGRDLAMQWALAAIFTRSRLVTGAPVSPTHVAFRQSAPRTHAGLVEVFGTSAIDFDAPVDSVSFRTADLELPLHTADPRLAAILQRYAATLPAPPPRATTWSDHLAVALATALDENSATLDRVARRLLMSRRSLQRRLAEDGTTWRAELDRARRRRYEQAADGEPLTRPEQAALLGYEDRRSALRAVKRWGG